MAGMNATKSVRIVGRDILVDGVRIGTMTSGREIYISVVETGHVHETTIARFKYGNRRLRANAWVKFIFVRLDVAELLARLKDTTPLELAWSLGFPKPVVSFINA